MKIRISADSSCDLNQELVEKYQITMLPLSVIIDGQEYRDGVDVTPENIFHAVEHGKKVKTAAANQFEYEALFKKLLEDGDAVIHFVISKEMSSCYLEACEAAEKLKNVYVVDSRNLSGGIALLVLEACELAAMGMSPQEIFTTVQRRTAKVCSSFTCQDVGYLHRGGRCSGLEALGAKMLKIVPTILVEDGRMHPGKKNRGSYEHYLKHYIKDTLKEVEDEVDYRRVFIAHSPCEDGMTDFAAECLREYGHFREILDVPAGGTVCVHCGPNTLGIMFMKK